MHFWEPSEIWAGSLDGCSMFDCELNKQLNKFQLKVIFYRVFNKKLSYYLLIIILFSLILLSERSEEGSVPSFYSVEKLFIKPAKDVH
jgi:hypothetical protein